MKKILSVVMILLCITGCSVNEKNQPSKIQSYIWITYYELNDMLEDPNTFRTQIEDVIKNCKTLDIKNIFIHIRAFGETIYQSDYFPLQENVKSYDFDIFKYIIEQCHKNGISVHAWINPYRISTSTTNIDQINVESPAYKWLKDENVSNDNNVGFANGIYLNPSGPNVNALVLDGIREIIAKYEIDGIHFDDYFYPTQSTDFDSAIYNQYVQETANPLSLSDWRRANVNALISACYTAIKYADKQIVFSVSPAADIQHNFENLYADVQEWVREGYVDIIIPQLYFGFEYPDENFRFKSLFNKWKNLRENKKTKLVIGLGNYKAIPTLEADKKEWQERSDIIARQVEICEQDTNISGYSYFSYGSLFGQESEYTKQRENILKYMQNKKEVLQ